VPVYKEGQVPARKDVVATYLNGEWNMIPAILSPEMENTPRPLPRNLDVRISFGSESLFYMITFEEFELMEAFEKLGANGEKVFMEFDAQVPRENMKIRLFKDKEPKEIIELKKFYVKP